MGSLPRQQSAIGPSTLTEPNITGKHTTRTNKSKQRNMQMKISDNRLSSSVTTLG